VARQLYFDGLLDSQSLAKIDLRVLVAPHFKIDRPLGRHSSILQKLEKSRESRTRSEQGRVMKIKTQSKGVKPAFLTKRISTKPRNLTECGF
jgi:hypothetical protein